MALLERSMESPPETERRPRRRLGGYLFWSVLLLAGVAYFLPQLAAQICQNRDGLAWLAGSSPGQVEVGTASLGWQAPVLLTEVRVNDRQGRRVAQVDSVTSQRSLWDLLTGPKSPLQLTLDGLHINVQTEEPWLPEGQLNLSILTRTLQDFQVPSPNRPMHIKFTNGTITFLGPGQAVVDEWNGLEGTYSCSQAPTREQDLAMEIPADPSHGRGAVQLTAHTVHPPGPDSVETVTLDVHGEGMSLLAAEPWLQKYLGAEHGLQRCSGTVQAQFDRDLQTGWKLQATANLNGVPSSNLPEGAVAFAGAPGGASLQLESNFSLREDLLSIPRLQLAADDAVLDVKGTVAQVSGEENFDINARMQTPGSSMLDLLPPSLREQINAEGVALSDVNVKGSLFPSADQPPRPLEISMEVGWKRAEAYGLQSENGRLRLSLIDGQLHAEPIDVRINDGILRRLPVIDLKTTPPTLRFDSGIMLENVALTEQVCRGWMKYVSPTLANATAAEGRFSLSMQPGRVQLGNIGQADLSGILTIHQGRVRPGPLAVAMLQNVNQFQGLILRNPALDLTRQTLMVIQDEPVGFHLHDGRVDHDEFGAFIGDVRVSTSGSVGLDQTLNLLVTMPIPDKWMQNAGPILLSLRGESIQLAVRGTLDEPDVDASALREFGKRVGLKAGAGLIEKILERRMQRGR